MSWEAAETVVLVLVLALQTESVLLFKLNLFEGMGAIGCSSVACAGCKSGFVSAVGIAKQRVVVTPKPEPGGLRSSYLRQNARRWCYSSCSDRVMNSLACDKRAVVRPPSACGRRVVVLN